MPIPDGEYMVCRDCRELLHIDKFSRAGRKDGFRRPECRSCQHQRSKEINPDYGYTEGSIDARANNNRSQSLIPAGIKSKKIKEQDGECRYCDTKLYVSSCDLDHIIPLSRGGKNEAKNFQALCSRCNKEKHSKNHEEYVKWLVDVGESHKIHRAKIKKYL